MKPEVTARARRDLLVILGASRERFGPSAERRYRHLIHQAIRDLGDDPARNGVVAYSDRGGVFLYHTRHSRVRTPHPRVGRPRHVIVFHFSGGRIVVLHVLHDAMNLPERLAEL